MTTIANTNFNWLLYQYMTSLCSLDILQKSVILKFNFPDLITLMLLCCKNVIKSHYTILYENCTIQFLIIGMRSICNNIHIKI